MPPADTGGSITVPDPRSQRKVIVVLQRALQCLKLLSSKKPTPALQEERDTGKCGNMMRKR